MLALKIISTVMLAYMLFVALFSDNDNNIARFMLTVMLTFILVTVWVV